MREWHQIPDDLIINFHQTPLSYVCSPNHTLHLKGGKSVLLVGNGKSKQINSWSMKQNSKSSPSLKHG